MYINLFDLIILIHKLCNECNFDETNIYIYATDSRFIYKISYPILVHMGIVARSHYETEEVAIKYFVYEYGSRVIKNRISYSMNEIVDSIIATYRTRDQIFLPVIIELNNDVFNSKINLSNNESYNSYKEFMKRYVVYM